MAEKRDKIIIYNTDLENKVTENLVLEQGEMALVREKDKERLYKKNTAGVVVPIHNILDGGELEIIYPTIQEAWIDSGLASWVKEDEDGNLIPDDVEPFNHNKVVFKSTTTRVPYVSDSHILKDSELMFSLTSPFILMVE